MIERLTNERLLAQIGTMVSSYQIIRTRKKAGAFSDIDFYGVALGISASGKSATWQFHIEDGAPNFYWGHYFMGDHERACSDFGNRA